MPNCSVIGCELKKGKDQPSITMHRLPTCKGKKKKWLEAIGMENIRQDVKEVFICSQHFDENFINRDLAIKVRLREDAIPSRPQRRRVNQDVFYLKYEDVSMYLITDQSDCSQVFQAADESTETVDVSESHPVISELPIQNKRVRRMKQLEHMCQEQRKKIRRLNQVVRRQNKKIADFRNIIKDLLKSNLLDSNDSCSKDQTDDNDMIVEEQYLNET